MPKKHLMSFTLVSCGILLIAYTFLWFLAISCKSGPKETSLFDFELELVQLQLVDCAVL